MNRSATSSPFSVLIEMGFYIAIEEDFVITFYMIYVDKIGPGVWYNAQAAFLKGKKLMTGEWL